MGGWKCAGGIGGYCGDDGVDGVVVELYLYCIPPMYIVIDDRRSRCVNIVDMHNYFTKSNVLSDFRE